MLNPLQSARRRSRLASALSFAVLAAASFCLVLDRGPAANAAPAPTPMPDRLDADALNAALGLQRSSLIRIAVDNAPGVPVRVVVAIDGLPLTLALEPVSVRAPGYRVYRVGADGVRHETPPTPERTLRGVVLDDPGSFVAASALDDGLHARIERSDGSVYWIEPVTRHFPTRADLDGMHVVYTADDVRPTDGVCGASGDLLIGRRPDPRDSPAASHGGPSVAELACDADFRYFQDYGTIAAVEDRINTVINVMDTQYGRDVQIQHQITAILVRTSQVYTSNNPEVLTVQFMDRWNTNHGDIQRDVAHLFTGRNLEDNIIGYAYIGVICTFPTFAYGIVESDFNGNLSCATDLSAHELGHNWNAEHCTCPSNTMNPFITCANVFSQQSINTITAFRDSVNCLGVAPANNDCAGAESIGDGLVVFQSCDATTDGPTLPAECNEGGGLTFVKDVWYDYTAPCDGTVNVNTCTAGAFDTRLAVYDGVSCVGAVIACSDDACGASGFQSEVTFAAVAGRHYRIRVGGDNDCGLGFLRTTCTPGSTCPEDLDMSGAVDFGDIVEILAVWGKPGGPEDLDGSGVVDFGDIVEILKVWGPCP